MSTKRHRLTPDIQQCIVAFIRAGGFPHVAAEAAGIPADVFDSWLAKGDNPRASARYREFADAVRQATAQARLTAETDARQGKPLDWLKSGPGRQTPDSAGWTAAARAPSAAPSSVLLTPEVQQLLTSLLDALAAHPDARAAVAAVLARISPDSASNHPHRRSSQP